jgi:hypothetical protein
MWLLGGKDDTGTLKNNVWNTEDGTTWTQVTAIAHASKMWMAGGHDGTA